MCHKSKDKDKDNKKHIRTLQVGLEPTTNRLTADRSTTELLKMYW